MAKNALSASQGKKNAPRCAVYAAKGIKTAGDFASMMSALMSDLIEGRINSQVGNAVCNAGGKMLKVVEMSHKMGRVNPAMPNAGKVLELVPLVPDETVQ